MADLHKFTTKEVLNKVLLDSSGNSVAALSHTSQEALNAVLDSANSRLNVSLVGGTISGDVTISGDLVVQGGGSLSYDETISGTLAATRVNIGTRDASDNPPTDNASYLLQLEKYGGTANIKLSRTGNASSEYSNNHNSAHIGTITEHQFSLRAYATDRLTISSAGNTDFKINDGGSVNVVPASGMTGTFNLKNSGGTILLGLHTALSTLSGFSNKSAIYASTALQIFGQGDNPLALGTNATNRLHITGDGKIGIGTSSPNALLSLGVDLTSTSTPSLIISDNAAYRGEFGYSEAASTQMWFNNSYDNADSVMQFRMAGSAKMTLKGDGHFGIGTTSPRNVAGNATLDVKNIYIGVNGALHGSINSDDRVYINFDADGSTDSSFIVAQGATGTGGTKRFIVDGNSRISLSNNDSGTDNTIFGAAAGSNITGDRNTFLGDLSGHTTTSGDDNTFIGSASGQGNTNLGSDNTFVGSTAGYQISSSESNTGIGKSSLSSNTVGGYNTAVGVNTLAGTSFSDSTCDWNAGGSADATVAHDANANIVVGLGVTGTHIQPGSYIASITDPTHFELNQVTSAGSAQVNQTLTFFSRPVGSVAVGVDALKSITTGASNTVLGTYAGDALTTGSTNVAIGYNALGAEITATSTVAIGRDAARMQIASGSTYSTYVGDSAGYHNVGGKNNTYLGAQAGVGAPSTNNDGNVAVGAFSMNAVTSGQLNVAVGKHSLDSITSGQNNVVLGANAGYEITTDYNVVAIGKDAYKANDTTNGHDGTATDGSGNTAIGYKSMTGLNDVNAFRNTMVGYETMVDCGSANASDNTALGFRALKSINNNSSDRNTAIGSSSLFALTTGNQNVAMGTSTGATMTTSSNNVLIGHNSGTAISAGQTTTDGTVAIGSLALTALTSGAGNVAIGYQAGLRHTTGSACVYIGHNVADHCIDGNRNVAIGEASLSGNADDDNVAVGYGALGVCTGADNVAIGTSAGNVIQAGNTNTMIGYDADASAHGAVNQIVIGASTTGLADNSAVIGNSAVTDVYMGSDSGAVVHSGALVNDLTPTNQNSVTLTYNAMSVQSGKYVTVSADAQTITLPAVQIGAVFIIVNKAADGGALLTISPDANDKFLTNIAGSVGTDGKDIINTKATQNQGDFVKLVGLNGDGWLIDSISGTWVDQA